MTRKQPSLPLSDQLREAIKSSGQTRYAISKATGVSEPTLSKFVNGHQGISLETADVLAEYLKLRLVQE